MNPSGEGALFVLALEKLESSKWIPSSGRAVRGGTAGVGDYRSSQLSPRCSTRAVSSSANTSFIRECAWSDRSNLFGGDRLHRNGRSN